MNKTKTKHVLPAVKGFPDFLTGPFFTQLYSNIYFLQLGGDGG
jgi:hypothetical protein